MTTRKPLGAILLVAAVAGAPVAFAQQGKGAGKGAKKAAAAASAAAASASVAATEPSALGSTGAAAAAAGSAGVAPPVAAAAGAATITPVAATTPGQSLDGQTYAVRLRELEQRVDELKEQIRRSHTRLSLLSDTVLSGGVTGSRAEVVFQNEMTNAFKLTRALFVLDGAVQYNKSDDTGALGDQPQIPIFSGSIPPGDHTLQVLVRLQGNGYGVFSYLKGYNFEVRSTHSFTATEGKTMSLSVIAYEKGGATTPLEDRPAVRFFEKVVTGIQGPLPSPGAGTATPATTTAPAASAGFSIGAGTK